jgi:hypothetical protein
MRRRAIRLVGQGVVGLSGDHGPGHDHVEVELAALDVRATIARALEQHCDPLATLGEGVFVHWALLGRTSVIQTGVSAFDGRRHRCS